MLSRTTLFAPVLLSLSVVVGCSRSVKDQGVAITPTATTSATLSVVPSPVLTTSPSASDAARTYLLTTAITAQKIVDQLEAVATHANNPNLADAQWRSEVRDAATEVKRLASDAQQLVSPRCLQAGSAELVNSFEADERTADQILASLTAMSFSQLQAASLAAAESNRYLSKATELLRYAKC